MLYPPDVKLLTVLKAVQGIPTYYVTIDDDAMMAYQVTGYYHADVQTAFKGGAGRSIPLTKADYSVSMSYLIENRYLLKPGSGPVYQVTRMGWYHRYVRRREIVHMLVTHVLFPSLVALITTLLTLLLTQP